MSFPLLLFYLFGAILLASVAGQSVAGEHQYNAGAAEHGEKPISWAHYLVTPEFGGDLLELVAGYHSHPGIPRRSEAQGH